MSSPEQIKDLLTPTTVARHYLKQPDKSTRDRLWYKSPFRHERTASFMVTNEGFHDFGDGFHGDIFDFIQRFYHTDFINAMKILIKDFGLPDDYQISKDLEKYIKQKREEEIRIQQNLDKWFYETYSNLCDKLHEWKLIREHTKGFANAYSQQRIQEIDSVLDDFLDVSNDDKINLWRKRKGIQKLIEE